MFVWAVIRALVILLVTTAAARAGLIWVLLSLPSFLLVVIPPSEFVYHGWMACTFAAALLSCYRLSLLKISGLMTLILLVAVSSSTWKAYQHYQKSVAIADQLVVDDLTERVATIPEIAENLEISPPEPEQPLVADELILKDLVEEVIQKSQEINEEPYWVQEWVLRRIQMIHENSLHEFLEAPEFGVFRMLHFPLDRYLEQQQPLPELRQPAPHAIEYRIDEPASVLPSLAWKDLRPQPRSFRDIHVSGMVNFVNPRGFGYVVSSPNLATGMNSLKVLGFQSHGFREIPATNPEADAAWADWQLSRIELVSLLKHVPPQVYVSESLPRMDELRRTSTRAMDSFEMASLTRLKAGEDLICEHQAQEIRVLGAIRLGKSCKSCHQGSEGALLGAFSYVFRTKSTEQTPPREPGQELLSLRF